MLNIETITVPLTSRWNATMLQTGVKPSADRRWSGLSEVCELLRFEGCLTGMDDHLMFRRRPIKAGHSVFLMNQTFDGLYVVRFGNLKTTVTHDNGGDHVLGFAMKGCLLGIDGICKNRYSSEAVALTDCELIRIPATELFSADRSCTDLERIAYWAISREVIRDQNSYALSRAAKSEVRVARFIQLQSEEFAAMGYSPRSFILPMTRRDIGSYLGVTLETVSRALSTLDQLGILKVVNRQIVIVSPQALREYEG
jgi:CRP/FNR family transcriptional regulator